MTKNKIAVDEQLLQRLRQSAVDAGDFTAVAELDAVLPTPLPTAVGTVIMWRENNDAGSDVGAFAERVFTDGEEQWRVNGFDLYPDLSMSIEMLGKTWWIMERVS